MIGHVNIRVAIVYIISAFILFFFLLNRGVSCAELWGSTIVIFYDICHYQHYWFLKWIFIFLFYLNTLLLLMFAWKAKRRCWFPNLLYSCSMFSRVNIKTSINLSSITVDDFIEYDDECWFIKYNSIYKIEMETLY